MSDEKEREQELERAGWNVLNLDARAIEIDLLTDVPHHPAAIVAERALAATAGGRRDPDPDELTWLAEAIFGPARYLAFSKGRSAELALSAAIVRPGARVLANGLFRTTQRSVEVRGGAVETSPPARTGSSAMDLDWARARAAEGPVAAIYVELASNARAGWPVDLDHLRALRGLCDEHGALFLIDATRGLANARALGLPVLATVRAAVELADAFMVSCAKEFLVPSGSLLGVRDLAVQRAAFLYGFEEGALLETAWPRSLLGEGLREVAARPDWIDRRAAQLARLAGELARLGVPLVEPLGAHAIFVRVDPEPPPGPHGNRALEALLYQKAGIRTLVQKSPLFGDRIMRLAVAIARHDDATLHRAAAGIATWLRSSDEAPSLTPIPSDCLHEQYFARYRRS
jgi:tryptophanase